jgi:hypothetical protein
MSNTTLQIALTPLGYETLMKDGLVNNIRYYNFNDNEHNYLVNATQELVTPFVGSHYQITNSKCAFAGNNMVYLTTPSVDEVKNVTSKVQLNFVNQDCSYNYVQPNVNVNINLNTWFNQLLSSTYNINMAGLTLEISDYVSATIQTLNLTTKTYDNVRYVTDLGLSWVPSTNIDFQNLMTLSPRGVKLTDGNQRMVYDETGVRFGSPFLFTFSSYEVNGNLVNNTATRLSLVTNEFGYWDGKTFLTTTQVETSDLASYPVIYPSVKVGNNTYYLPTNVAYPTTEGFIGYALQMVNVNGNGDNALTGLVNQAKLFMKTYGKFDKINNVYSLPITLNVIATNPEINYITEKAGGVMTINVIYNPSDNTSDPVQIIS